ncbi:MAG TPA: hypothetical protein VFR11_00005, partial [Micromonosporaceae bacterium]|nr:hypothetical protein [Micromonosporaceae bacterium]
MSRGAARRGTATPEQALLRRVAWRITIQTAAMFIAGLVALGALAVVLIDRAQGADNQRALREAIADVDAVSDPPTNIVVYEVDALGRHTSPQLHGRALDPGAVDRVQGGAAALTTNVRFDGRTYL